FDFDQLVGFCDQRLVKVVYVFHRRAIDRNDIFTAFGAYSGGAERGYQGGVPTLTGKNTIYPVITAFIAAESGTQQSHGNAFNGRAVSTVYIGMAYIEFAD